MDSHALLGTWTLVSFVRRIDGEPRHHMLGEHPSGLISYQADGHMSAILTDPDRPWPAGVNFRDGSPADQAAAAALFSAYGGSYTLDGDVVTHHVRISAWPEHVGTDLVRRVSWIDGDLLLTTEPVLTPSGKALDDQLRWHKLGYRE
ncbi:MAG TPA: lipocalin-like domain-containing protein [Ilumatobacteraceae bacterium]|nr:lipocalin-like domain-containing protein [Ilumatobacteraceae bacterium]